MNGPNIHIMQRQVLGSVLGGVGSIVSGVGSGINSAVSGVGAGVTSGLGDITSAILPSTTTSTTTSPSSSSTSVTSTSTTSSSSSTITSTSTSSSLTSISSTTTSSSTSSSSVYFSSSTTSAPSSASNTSPLASIYTSNGVKETITAFVTSSASPSPTQSATGNSNGFLNNKPLEGFVFALCGLVAIVILVLVTTFALRRSRRKRMINEALSYEPTTTHGYVDDTERNITEKTRESYSSTGSSGSGLGPPYSVGPVAVGPPGMSQQVAYGYERENPAYAPRSPNPAYDATRSYGPSYGIDQVPQAPVIYAPPAGVSQAALIQPGLLSTSARVPVPAMSP
ncbi:hypothetical protein GGU10DRAFT_383207 [Lentinula aff. detonsa]|uniref:Transmembrane protein n=1 Tax=Lentinula aff. detonsa TaxID=2804958 RepID=A0AA38U7D4_9AGAR|nr:hypothetical protein GGU10DRAFT_383207 [Lentinula aff. detonsa]